MGKASAPPRKRWLSRFSLPRREAFGIYWRTSRVNLNSEVGIVYVCFGCTKRVTVRAHGPHSNRRSFAPREHDLGKCVETTADKIFVSKTTQCRPGIREARSLNEDHSRRMACCRCLFFIQPVNGLVYRRKGTWSTDDYFVSGRNVSWWLAGTSMVAATFAADTPLAVTGLVATQGIAGNWLWWGCSLVA